MSPEPSLTRRTLLGGAGAGCAAALAPCWATKRLFGAEKPVPPSERITIGLIGVGRQAHHYNIKQFLEMPDVQVVAICDVDSWRLEQAKAQVEKHYAASARDGVYRGCDIYHDFREILEREDVDAVMISAPDHWHVPMAVRAVEAGKDVCCEKPLTRSIAEGRILSDAVRRHGRVFRTDSEFRSLQYFHRAVELVRNGRLGKPQRIDVGVPGTDEALGPQAEIPVPSELDYAMWLGPAPEAPYTVKRVHPPRDFGRPGWMRNRDYCDGMITNWGAHLCDIAQWGNGTDRSGPVEIEGTGHYPPREGLWNVLLSFDLQYRYANGVIMTYRTDKAYVRFVGSEGTIYGEYPRGLTAEPASLLEEAIGPDEHHWPLKPEKRDFIDAVKNRGETLADAEVGHRTMSVCHLGEIAIQTGRKLSWDPDEERFTNCDEAIRMLSKPSREPWAVKAS